MKLNTKHIADELTEEFGGMSKKDAHAFVTATFECIMENLEAGHEIAIPGFGKMRVKARPERQARNPKTGEAMTVAAKKVPNVLFAKQLKERVNG